MGASLFDVLARKIVFHMLDGSTLGVCAMTPVKSKYYIPTDIA